MKNFFALLLANSMFLSAYASDTFSPSRLENYSTAHLEAQRIVLENDNIVPPIDPVNPPNIDGYALIELINESENVADENVYILLKGQDGNDDQCYLSIASDGIGSYAYASASPLSTTYSYTFSSLPGKNGHRYLYVPQPFISGRMYFSVNYPLLMAIVNDTITDPSGFNATDPNYYTLYDKIELTFTEPDINVDLYTNPTAVDFFSLPLYMQITHPVGEFSAAGLPLSRATVLNDAQSVVTQFNKTAPNVWEKLFLPFYDDPYAVNPALVTYLRISAPAPACAPGAFSINPNQIFPNDYLLNATTYGFNYVDNVWNFYKGTGNTLRIDAREIATHYGPGPGNPDYYYYVGEVNSSNQFTFTNLLNSDTVIINKPTTSYPFFAGAGFSFAQGSEANNTPGAIIIRQLTSAFEVGVLPRNFTSGNYMTRAFFETQKPYYTPNTEWGSGQDLGPFYDLYSKSLHSFDYPIYTFAYDDALGQDGTLIGAVQGLGSSLKITLKPINTNIPDPFDDNSNYTVTINAGANNPVSYRQGTSGSFTPYSGPISNVTSNAANPFQIQLRVVENSSCAEEILTLYLKYNIVIPPGNNFQTASGVVITHGNPFTNVTISTPGRSVPCP